MSPELKNKIREVWLKAFETLKGLKKHEIRKEFHPRQMAGLYAVASICYDDGNHEPVISDPEFDRLCESIDEHFDECVKAGADLLDRKLVQCHSGHDTRIFVKSYHEIAGVLLGHPCRCLKCRHESLVDHERVGSLNFS